ncbi:hypothetical protein AtubIFM55763_000982 [Aspergillus tubingensis]|nr:hypothetical protein AtubIFM55763_000982 [Aspergillus tubingensis]
MGTDLLTSSGNRTLDTESACFLLPPLTRRGIGPGMVIVLPDDHSIQPTQGKDVPAPAFRWAEEGYTVIEILKSGLKREKVLRLAIKALARHDKCAPNDMISIHMAPNYGKSYTVFLASFFSEEK